MRLNLVLFIFSNERTNTIMKTTSSHMEPKLTTGIPNDENLRIFMGFYYGLDKIFKFIIIILIFYLTIILTFYPTHDKIPYKSLYFCP